MVEPTAFSDQPVGPLLERGARRAAAWQAHALADLEWADAERPTEELRASAQSIWEATARDAADRLAVIVGWEDRAAAAIAVLVDADWATPQRLRPALIEAQHRLLSARVMAAARPFGPTDPLDALTRKKGRTGALARDLLYEQEREPVVLPAEDWHELGWACAAALRVVAQRSGNLTQEQDETLRQAVKATLARYDEASGADALARRLARRLSPDRLMPGAVLLAGHTHLAAALLAERTPVAFERVSEWLLAPDPFLFAVALRAGGEDVAGIGGLMSALTGARGQAVSALADRIAGLHSLSVEAASDCLRKWVK